MLGFDLPAGPGIGALAERWRQSVRDWQDGLRPAGAESGWLEQRIGLRQGTTASRRPRWWPVGGTQPTGPGLSALADIGVLARAVSGAGTGVPELASMRRLMVTLTAERGSHLEDAVRTLRGNGTAPVTRQDLRMLLAAGDEAQTAREGRPVRPKDLRPAWAAWAATVGAADPRTRVDQLVSSIGSGDLVELRLLLDSVRDEATGTERSIRAVLELTAAILENRPGRHVLPPERNVDLDAHRVELGRQLARLSEARPRHAEQLTDLTASVFTCPPPVETSERT
ncbi:hypothetical protein [Dactylosporangium sp. CA-233914]|uniref:hypothetical protein n=1 Tax=Dactylosporangium sp. CA-233914 TaxID=3239934 RepID=UPI003D8D9B76